MGYFLPKIDQFQPTIEQPFPFFAECWEISISQSKGSAVYIHIPENPINIQSWELDAITFKTYRICINNKILAIEHYVLCIMQSASKA